MLASGGQTCSLEAPPDVDIWWLAIEAHMVGEQAVHILLECFLVLFLLELIISKALLFQLTNLIFLSPAGPILATSVFLLWKRIPPVVPRRCYKQMTIFCILASWLTFTMYVAVELLPIGNTFTS